MLVRKCLVAFFINRLYFNFDDFTALKNMNYSDLNCNISCIECSALVVYEQGQQID